MVCVRFVPFRPAVQPVEIQASIQSKFRVPSNAETHCTNGGPCTQLTNCSYCAVYQKRTKTLCSTVRLPPLALLVGLREHNCLVWLFKARRCFPALSAGRAPRLTCCVCVCESVAPFSRVWCVHSNCLNRKRRVACSTTRFSSAREIPEFH